MDDKDIYRSLKRDFFVKELEAKGIDCSGLSLEDVLILAEENNVTGINDINPEPREKTAEKIQFAQPEELLKDTNVFEPMPEAKVMEDVPELKKEDFMEEFAKEMDDEISKGREEIEKSKAYLENLLKSNGIDTKDLTYTYMLDLAAKLQKDLEPKEPEETKVNEEATEEKHIWDDSEISKDYKEEPSEPLMIKVPKEPEHTAIAEIQDLIKKVDAVINPKEEQLTRRQKILKGFLVKELSAIESVDKEWLKNAPYEDIINKANEFPHIIEAFGVSPEFEEYKKVTEEAINKVIDFVAGRQEEMLSDITETKINENLWSNHFPGAINGDELREVNKWLQEEKKAKEEKSNNHPSALLLNKSFMQGFLYSKTDIGVLRLSGMSYSELLDECKKFVGFKNSLENRFDFIEDPEWTNTLKDYVDSNSDDDKMSITFQGETTVVPYGNMLYNIICEVLWYKITANYKLEYLGDVNILAHAILGGIKNPIVANIDGHDEDRIKELIQALSLKFGINEPEYKKATVSDVSSLSTEALIGLLIKREGIEPHWIGPETSYTIDIANPTNSCHKALYFNGSGPLWIIFHKDKD
jgi:hypothetical protein